MTDPSDDKENPADPAAGAEATDPELVPEKVVPEVRTDVKTPIPQGEDIQYVFGDIHTTYTRY